MTLEGSEAPEFERPSTGGGTVSLSERVADGPAVVLVNRGHWCSFCAEQTEHGPTGVAGTYVVDEAGVVRYEQVADRPADRTYGNRIWYFIANGYEDPFTG